MTDARWWRYGVAGALASAALLGAVALVRAPWHWLVFVAWIPWLFALDRCTLRGALASSALLAAGFVATAFHWLPATLSAYAHKPLIVTWPLALLLAPILLQPQLIAAGACRVLARRMTQAFARPRPWIGAATALAYVGAEWALPRLFADTAGYGLYPSAELRQCVELATGRGLTLGALVVNECILAALVAVGSARLRPLLVAALIVGAQYSYGSVRLAQVEARTREASTFAAGVIQANITAYDKLAAEQGTFETVRQILDAHEALSRGLLAGGPLELLVWPETVYPTTFGAPKSEDGAAFDARITALVAESGVPLVFGAFEESAAGEHNAAFFLQPTASGIQRASYKKTLLFPLTEELPGWLESERVRAALPWAGRWHPGAGPRALPLRLRDGSALRVAPLICYEALDSSYAAAGARQGAQVLLTLSNDAWFPDAAGARLHLLVAAHRSVELRLPQIRATNSGISALVLPSGELVAPAPFGTARALRLDVPRVPPTWTPVRAFGDWLGWAALVACALLLAWLSIRSWRGARRPSTARPRAAR